uniref:RNase H type-1 domain-containing protein n=1 Tax=Quercus lobata TaxID=97700 RepID=A0A7N2N6Z2_QUELO
MDNVLTPEPSLPVWFPTPLGWNKVNVDAALSSSKSALAAVARDHRGHVIKLSLPSRNNGRLVFFEGDAKGCFDTLASTDLLPDWSICTVINDIRSLVASLPFFKFCGAQRSCNSAAKFALSSCQSFCFNNGNLPLYIESVFEVDCQAYSFVSV